MKKITRLKKMAEALRNLITAQAGTQSIASALKKTFPNWSDREVIQKTQDLISGDEISIDFTNSQWGKFQKLLGRNIPEHQILDATSSNVSVVFGD
jgi:DNA polymerase III gamma/tau subunit